METPHTYDFYVFYGSMGFPKRKPEQNFKQNTNKTKRNQKAGEMAPWLGALAVFAEDLGFILSTHRLAHNRTLSRVWLTLLNITSSIQLHPPLQMS